MSSIIQGQPPNRTKESRKFGDDVASTRNKRFKDFVNEKECNVLKAFTEATSRTLESLPNELLLNIFSYLNPTNITRSFFELNNRFNSLVADSVRCCRIPNNTDLIWFSEYIPHIEQKIENISLDVHLVSRVFNCKATFSNLRSIVLTESFIFTVELNVNNYSPLNAVMSFMDVIKICNIWTHQDFMYEDIDQFAFFHSHSRLDQYEQVNMVSNTLPCPAIIQLTINECTEQDLLCLTILAPNMTYLKIKSLNSSENLPAYPALSALVRQPTSLKQLHISCHDQNDDDIFIFDDDDDEEEDEDDTTSRYLNSLHKLIVLYRLSLQELTLRCCTKSLLVDGEQLQNLLRPLQFLKKLNFSFEHRKKNINFMEQVRMYKSDWWLEPTQPTVLLLFNKQNKIFIGSMPSIFEIEYEFSPDIRMWQINKGPIVSPNNYFARKRNLEFSDNDHTLITLDLLHIIKHMFRAPNQSLSLNYWGLVPSLIMQAQQDNDKSWLPTLPNITHIQFSNYDLNGLDPATLSTWLSMLPNVEKLNLMHLNTSDVVTFGKELRKLVEGYHNLKITMNRIRKLDLFLPSDSCNEIERQFALEIYSKVFQRARIS